MQILHAVKSKNHFFLLFVILGLAAWLRLVNLAENPGWYTDETTHIDIAQNLMRGEVRYMAIEDSVVLFSRLPLFHVLLALIFQMDGDPLVLLRGFTGLLGVISVALVYVVGWAAGNRGVGLLGAFALAIYPQAILYSRFGFSYNLLAPLMLVLLIGLIRWQGTGRARWLALASLALGLGIITEISGLTFALPFVAIVLVNRRRVHLLWSLPLALLPLAIFAGVMLVRAPDALLFDLRFVFGRLNVGATVTQQVETLAGNLRVLITQDVWMPAGMVGLLLLRPARLRWSALLIFWLVLMVIGRTNALYSLSAYYLIPLLPLVALGIGNLTPCPSPLGEGRNTKRVIIGARDRAVHHHKGMKILGLSFGSLRLCGSNCLFISPIFSGVVILVLVASLPGTLREVTQGFRTAIDPFLLNAADVRAVVGYLNENSSSEDVVVTSPPIGWLLDARAADFQMAVAAAGQATPHLPAEIPANRWAFDPTFDNARYAVVDPLWRRWGVIHVPGLDAALREIESSWRLVFEAGEIRVYQH